METVIVQRVSAGQDSPSEFIRLSPGETLTFGRGSPATDVDLVLEHAEVGRLAGQITAVDDHWALTNLSRARTYVVENPEGGGEHVKVPPRRLCAPIPFELSRILLPVSVGRVAVMVFAPEHTFADPSVPMGADGQLTASNFSLDETAKYFTILVALCEPRLREPSSSALPTASEVIDRLAPLPGFENLTRTAVNYHIDYLAQTKLRLRELSDPSRSARIEYKRAALVAYSIRFDLVREEHLALLPRAAHH
jgi:hypothetical protein